MPRRTLYDADDLRAVLDRPGEVRIGAWARRHRRRQWLIALAGVALVALAALVYAALTTADSPGDVRGYAVELRCIQCAYEQSRRVEFDQTFPILCPRCQERSLQPLWECRLCKERFIPTGSPERASCPMCGSSQVGSAAAKPPDDDTPAADPPPP